MARTVELGSGLIGIGRVWGVENKPVPRESDALAFLEYAYESGIRVFDTAPAYGVSEQRLGKFLQTLSSDERDNVFVATKFGEHWIEDGQTTRTDHSYEAMVSSLDRSMALLGKIDLIQLHKASIQLINDTDVNQAFEYAALLGVKNFGVSVSDVKTGLVACDDDRFSYIQLPYNADKPEMREVIQRATEVRKKVLFNRPFAMGSLFVDAQQDVVEERMRQAYALIFETGAYGVVLTGTSNIGHLSENMKAFDAATKD